MCNEVMQIFSNPSWVEIGIFIVTTLYLIATVCVFLVNRRMAKAAEDQLTAATRMAELSRNVELFDKRQKVLGEIEYFIENIMQSYDMRDESKNIFIKYSKTYILSLFDERTLEFWEYFEKKDTEVYRLVGKFDHAESHGTCNGETCPIIMGKINEAVKETKNKFESIKQEIIDKYFKI